MGNWSAHRCRSIPSHSWTPTMPNMKNTKKHSSKTLPSIGNVSSNSITSIRIPLGIFDLTGGWKWDAQAPHRVEAKANKQTNEKKIEEEFCFLFVTDLVAWTRFSRLRALWDRMENKRRSESDARAGVFSEHGTERRREGERERENEIESESESDRQTKCVAVRHVGSLTLCRLWIIHKPLLHGIRHKTLASWHIHRLFCHSISIWWHCVPHHCFRMNGNVDDAFHFGWTSIESERFFFLHSDRVLRCRRRRGSVCVCARSVCMCCRLCTMGVRTCAWRACVRLAKASTHAFSHRFCIWHSAPPNCAQRCGPNEFNVRLYYLFISHIHSPFIVDLMRLGNKQYFGRMYLGIINKPALKAHILASLNAPPPPVGHRAPAQERFTRKKRKKKRKSEKESSLN